MHDWLQELAGLADEGACGDWIAVHPEYVSRTGLEQVHAGVIELVYVDLDRAARLARCSVWLAEAAGDPLSRALAQRCSGHACFSQTDYVRALEHYQKAVDLLEPAELDLEIARTLNGALQSLIYLGEDNKALEWAGRASDIFRRHGDGLRLARLNSNIGNILYRQDRYPEAIARYEEALLVLRESGEPRDVGATMINCLVCSISLGRFDDALQFYQEVRRHCEVHQLEVLVATSDYNIAYLHYLQGDYMKAMQLYQQTRLYCDRVGDAYHGALCDLDEGELYLELNLATEGGHLAKRAAARFEKLGLDYERAKALVSVAIATSRESDAGAAARYFRAARRLFAAQKNRLWPALIDLDRAILYHGQGKGEEAARLCERAFAVLKGTDLPGRAALCRLLKARLSLARKQVDVARAICLEAVADMQSSGAAGHRYQAVFVLGQIEEAAGRREAAIAAYRSARQEVESLRGHLWGEVSRIAFLKDKLAVYESLFVLHLGAAETSWRNSPAVADAFQCVEQAKSRSMAEMLSVPELLTLSPELQEIRKDLNWCYRQGQHSALTNTAGTDGQGSHLRRQIRDREDDLSRRFTALCTDRPALSTGDMTLSTIQAAIPEHTLLIEYFEARGDIYACLLDGISIEIRRVTHPAKAHAKLRLLQLQISKFRFGPAYMERFGNAWRLATEAHLRELYDLLFRPIRDATAAYRHLIVVPHRFLHSLPWHALNDGKRYLIDDFSISYAPSAGVFARCAVRPPGKWQGSLVLGVADPTAPNVEEEARGVAGALPGSRLYLGERATWQLLREYGPASRFLHIATHGLFRRDNPLFSSIRLGDGPVCLLDLYQIPLSAELVTLSGCNTGMNAVVGGDELLGLVRGLLCAGAASALVALWDVSDRSTAEFMRIFYESIASSPDKSAALRTAMLKTREEYPHPYNWAPFVMVGRS